MMPKDLSWAAHHETYNCILSGEGRTTMVSCVLAVCEGYRTHTSRFWVPEKNAISITIAFLWMIPRIGPSPCRAQTASLLNHHFGRFKEVGCRSAEPVRDLCEVAIVIDKPTIPHRPEKELATRIANNKRHGHVRWAKNGSPSTRRQAMRRQQDLST